MIEVIVEPGRRQRGGTLVVVAGAEAQLGAAGSGLDRASGGLISRALRLQGGEAKPGRMVELVLPQGLEADRLLVATLGPAAETGRLQLEELGGSIVQRLRQQGAVEATLASLDGLDLPLSTGPAMAAVTLGMLLRDYRFDKYRTSENGNGRLERLYLAAEVEEAALGRARETAAAVSFARDLTGEPANVLTPTVLAQACHELEAFGIEVEVLGLSDIERLGMGALIGVAQGSTHPPQLVVMRWQGAEGAPLALVGKGICFDSGGLSIKPAAGMEEMKFDMAGAAAVMGAMRIIAARKARLPVVGVIGIAENMVSATAQRPGDVVRSMAGKTIEVANTDAEGRLVLADALWYAAERFKPRAMVDLATLTGAIMVALGREQAGLFATDDDLATRLKAAGERVGEPMWRMPLGKAYDRLIKSDIADLRNVGRGREAGSSVGAAFLQPFTNGVPWAHLDIAGTAWAQRDLPLAPKGATAYGVRLLDALAESYEG